MFNPRRYEEKDLRIAIIGAGIAGLTAAHTLKKYGYNNVVIFESGDQAGGKIHTLEIDGAIYELGAIFVPEDAHTIRNIAEDYGFKLTKQLKKVFYCRDGKQISMMRDLWKNFSAREILKAMIHIPGAAVKIKKYMEGIADPGFSEADPALYVSFKKFLDDNGIGIFAHTAEPLSHTYCYGFLDQTPAFYFLKLIKTGLVFIIKDVFNSSLGLRFHLLPMFDKGYQRLLEAIAKKFAVRYNAKVTEISRKKSGETCKIKITSNRQTETFDRVIISSMPAQTLRFLDATRDEKKLFSRVKTYAYHEFVFRGDFKMKGSGIIFDNSYHKQYRGFPAALSNFNKSNNIYQTYQMHDGSLTEEELLARLHDMAGILGGNIFEILISKNITYFPHYSVDDLAELEPFRKLEEIQGENGTYFIGGLFNMEGSNWSSEYAEALIQRHF